MNDLITREAAIDAICNHVHGISRKRATIILRDAPAVEYSQSVNKIGLHDAIEYPVWLMIWAAEPERLLDVRMSCSDLKVIRDLIIKERGNL